ncbi:GNAT family N-acetyltransferase [uncultured Cyclobacterium sp.]|uniref:GNAT family N-acetyltransferase n=1 Tax=uncultured Cyclobacterium sp. TaxID=453820 RepID=UPI0030EE03BF|tara:strand:- start:13106 stop:13966 length:861 start_codon:yes stop_codon:yes gene_type:complete
MDSELFIREMQVEDLDAAMRLKSEEGWNQTRGDWELFLVNNPDLCLVVVAEEKVVGTVCSFSYKGELAWIGMMLVDRMYRRKGISKRLMHEVIQRIGGNQTIKLDATPAGQKVYEQIGFVKEYSLFRWVRPKGAFQWINPLPHEVLKISKEDFTEILHFDKKAFGIDREVVLLYLFKKFPQGAFLVKREGELVGFVLCRLGSKFLQLGPLIASNDAIAQALISRVLEDFHEIDLVLDLVEHHSNLNPWLEKRSFAKQRELIRMFIPPQATKGDIDSYYLITGPELG